MEKLSPEHCIIIVIARSSVRPDLPLALPHLPGEIFQLLGLPVGVLDLVYLLEPIPAAANNFPIRINPTGEQPVTV